MTAPEGKQLSLALAEAWTTGFSQHFPGDLHQGNQSHAAPQVEKLGRERGNGKAQGHSQAVGRIEPSSPASYTRTIAQRPPLPQRQLQCPLVVEGGPGARLGLPYIFRTEAPKSLSSCQAPAPDWIRDCQLPSSSPHRVRVQASWQGHVGGEAIQTCSTNRGPRAHQSAPGRGAQAGSSIHSGWG